VRGKRESKKAGEVNDGASKEAVDERRE